MDEEWLDVVPESSAEVGLDTTTVQALKDLLTAERCLNCTWFSTGDLCLLPYYSSLVNKALHVIIFSLFIAETCLEECFYFFFR